ncbi:MAG: hypothetical protein IKG94_04345 [Candidatus Methanomethylophilaceae archaeon]|nr:hypothetical protein [Candidatus Methanomethylophilaceae archaeon]
MIAIVAVAAIIAAGAVVVASQNGGSDVKSEPISIVTNPDFAPTNTWSRTSTRE